MSAWIFFVAAGRLENLFLLGVKKEEWWNEGMEEGRKGEIVMEELMNKEQ